MNLEDSDWIYAYYQKQEILSFHIISLKSESDTQNGTHFGYDRQESFCCPVSLNEWVIAPDLMCFFYLMTWWICTYRALVP